MQGRERILDDVARVAGGTVSVLSGLQKQIKEEILTHIEDAAAKLDLVPREDFERLESMIAQAREEQEKQKQKIAELENRLATGKK